MSGLVILHAKLTNVRTFRYSLINEPTRHTRCQSNCIQLCIGNGMKKRDRSSAAGGDAVAWYAAGGGKSVGLSGRAGRSSGGELPCSVNLLARRTGTITHVVWAFNSGLLFKAQQQSRMIMLIGAVSVTWFEQMPALRRRGHRPLLLARPRRLCRVHQ